jgi:hypothetical protein
MSTSPTAPAATASSCAREDLHEGEGIPCPNTLARQAQCRKEENRRRKRPFILFTSSTWRARASLAAATVARPYCCSFASTSRGAPSWFSARPCVSTPIWGRCCDPHDWPCMAALCVYTGTTRCCRSQSCELSTAALLCAGQLISGSDAFLPHAWRQAESVDPATNGKPVAVPWKKGALRMPGKPHGPGLADGRSELAICVHSRSTKGRGPMWQNRGPLPGQRIDADVNLFHEYPRGDAPARADVRE